MYFCAKVPSPLRMTALLEQLLVPQPVKKFHALYKIQMPIAKFTTAQHMNLSTARLIKSKPFHMNTSFMAVFQLPLHNALCVVQPSSQYSQKMAAQFLYRITELIKIWSRFFLQYTK